MGCDPKELAATGAVELLREVLAKKEGPIGVGRGAPYAPL